jgi:hypothetical protein
MSFLTFGSNFSLLARISHFVAAHAPISHFWLEFLPFFTACMGQFLTLGSNFSLFTTFPAKFSLSSKFLTFPARPQIKSRTTAPLTPALPMTWLPPPCYWHVLTGWRALADHRSTCRRAKSENFSVPACEK